MRVIMFKIASGEHFVAEVIDESGNELLLKNHCNVFPAVDGSNSVTVLPTYNMFSPAGVLIRDSNIIYIGEPNEEILEQYIAAFSPKSDIIMPSNQIII